METSRPDPVDIALDEDVGSGDLTSLFFIPDTLVSEGRIFAKEPCVVAGVEVVRRIYRKLDPRIELHILRPDGSVLRPGESVIELSGLTRPILTGERVALNFIQRLSGIATLTAQFVEAVRVPKLPRAALFHASKISKRFDENISAVCGSFRLSLDGCGHVIEARLAYGGMAATPKRAAHAEAALTGAAWDDTTTQRAMDALAADYQPLSDMRASSAYRLKVARNLLRRFQMETRDHAPLALLDVNAFAFEAGEASAAAAQESS